MKKLSLLVSGIALAGLLVSCNGKKAADSSLKVLHVQVGPSPETIDPTERGQTLNAVAQRRRFIVVSMFATVVVISALSPTRRIFC